MSGRRRIMKDGRLQGSKEICWRICNSNRIPSYSCKNNLKLWRSTKMSMKSWQGTKRENWGRPSKKLMTSQLIFQHFKRGWRWNKISTKKKLKNTTINWLNWTAKNKKFTHNWQLFVRATKIRKEKHHRLADSTRGMPLKKGPSWPKSTNNWERKWKQWRPKMMGSIGN